MTGQEIKNLIIAEGVLIWEVGAALGMNDGNFSRRLRKPFSEAEVKHICEIIKEIKEKEEKMDDNK